MKILSKLRTCDVLTISMLIGAAAVLILSAFAGFAEECDAVRGEVLRLHILPHSNNEHDLALKYDLRDYLLDELAIALDGAANLEQAKELAESNLPEIEQLAARFVKSAGFDYPVTVSLETAWFGTRVYENLTMPAGEYYAMRVVIGDGAGDNWWCVAFPPLCLPAVAGTGSGAGAGNSKAAKEPYFTPEASRLIEQGGKVEVRFAVYEWVLKRLR
ncbi:MAG: stage II sporulation protein R [Oscillospiraceae bacterium]|nr:stage II sporulation protein R [Oscillospiraceae bacterium]